MPVRKVGKDCYQWGNQKVYCGTDAKRKAILQGIAIENTGWREAEEADEGDWWVITKKVSYHNSNNYESRSVPSEIIGITSSETAKMYFDHLKQQYKREIFKHYDGRGYPSMGRRVATYIDRKSKWDNEADKNTVHSQVSAGGDIADYLGFKWLSDLPGSPYFPSTERKEDIVFERVPASKVRLAEEMTTNLPILILTGIVFALSLPYFLDSRGNKV